MKVMMTMNLEIPGVTTPMQSAGALNIIIN